MRFFFFSFFFFFLSNSISSQINYPKDYFCPPLDIPMHLSGNFGELRPNHFHAGLDFKTLQKEGLAVRAVADGYVSRIKISTFGNGKTIYITHPNGFTSVYGHLQRAADQIEEFIKKAHYEDQSFEIERFLKPGVLVVKKGQIIAFSGNTGASEGPHLHFEFRDNRTENIINPLFFGFDKFLKDTKKPQIYSVYAYPVDNESVVNQSKRPLLLNLVLQKDGTYLADKVVANGKIGFGISTFDYDDVSFSKNGVFKVQTFYNGSPNFGYQFDTYSFDEMRYVNALIDYSMYKNTQLRVQKLFMNTPYKLSIIEADTNNGVIAVVPNLTAQYRIEVSDYFGNLTTVSIPIVYKVLPLIINKDPVSKYLIKAKNDSNFSKENVSVFFPANTFYEDFNLNFDVISDTLYLHNDKVPVHSNFIIEIKNRHFAEAQNDKLFIASVGLKKLGYNSTIRKGTIFSTNVKTLGKYALVLDTVPPKIVIAKPITNKWLTDKKFIQVSISDDLSGIKSYHGYLNGKWILFEYDNKTKKITHDFSDGIVTEGANELKIIVVDNLGNSSIFETRFFRSQKQ
jgi:murein DD-endopeptidase MepM/ murein hydrolase activator NlpD